MIALWNFLRGPARIALGSVPRPIWYILSAILALLLLWNWHDRRVAVAYAGGARAQADVDRARFEAATNAAVTAQRDLAATLATRQTRISKGTDDALLVRNADLARDYDDLRLRWAAHRTAQDRAGQTGATAVPAATSRVDDSACPALGWVSFDIAAAAAEAADTAIAKDDAWIAWARAQAAAWPVR